MISSLANAMKRWRENYYFSHVLSAAIKPVQAGCAACARQIQEKVKRNGASIEVGEGQILRFDRDAGVNLASLLFWSGLDGYEPETMQTMRFFFQRVSTFVDVGANYGLYSILGAISNPKIRVVAFEPVAEIYSGLLRNIALNHVEGRVDCENLALASVSGPAKLYLPKAPGRDLEATGTLSAESWQVRQGAPAAQVQAVRFDEYESQHPMRVDFIKIDVEDFEADVLAGMERVIRRDRPFVVCEILPRNREHKNEKTREIIQALGYTPFWIAPGGYIRITRFDFERKFLNFLLSPVSLPGEVFDSPNQLWECRQREFDLSV